MKLPQGSSVSRRPAWLRPASLALMAAVLLPFGRASEDPGHAPSTSPESVRAAGAAPARPGVDEVVSGGAAKAGPRAVGHAHGEPAGEGAGGESPALESNANLFPQKVAEDHAAQEEFQARLEEGLKYKREKAFADAENIFVTLLLSSAPEAIQRKALLELGILAQQQRQFTRAQQIFAQYVAKYREDQSIPEVLLLQGLVYREMGVHGKALEKFYSVISSSLSFEMDRMAYYQRLVLRAQTEIAETFYLKGEHPEAAERFRQILKLKSPELNRAQIHCKLLRTLAAQALHAEVVTQGQQYVAQHPDGREMPEVRFLLSSALKKLGRNREAAEQVMALLQVQKGKAGADPEYWTRWQQKTGNEIGNQLYEEGDYVNALEIYLKLSSLSQAAPWQLPVLYQIGLVYERLAQPRKASESYAKIDGLAGRVEGGEMTPALHALIDMARWRREHLQWQAKAQQESAQLRAPVADPRLAATTE